MDDFNQSIEDTKEDINADERLVKAIKDIVVLDVTKKIDKVTIKMTYDRYMSAIAQEMVEGNDVRKIYDKVRSFKLIFDHNPDDTIGRTMDNRLDMKNRKNKRERLATEVKRITTKILEKYLEDIKLDRKKHRIKKMAKAAMNEFSKVYIDERIFYQDVDQIRITAKDSR